MFVKGLSQPSTSIGLSYTKKTSSSRNTTQRYPRKPKDISYYYGIEGHGRTSWKLRKHKHVNAILPRHKERAHEWSLKSRQPPPNPSRILDSGALNHMTGNKRHLCKLQGFYGGHVLLRNDSWKYYYEMELSRQRDSKS